MTVPPATRRRRRIAPLLVLALAVTLAPAAGASAAPPPDPRVGLGPDQEAISNLTKLSSNPIPEGSVINSDLAFKGRYTFSANFNGFNVYDVRNAAAPVLTTSYVCPGSQNDISVYRNLLFLSVEQATARVDCTTKPTSKVFRGVRVFDISDVRAPKLVANVQTCRGSHTHTLVEDPKDRRNLYVYVSGTAGVRPASELASCNDGDARSADPSRWRIDVIKVPLAAPQRSAVVSGPRLFRDARTGAVDGLQNEPPTPRHPSGEEWFPEPVTESCHDITAYPQLGLAAGACAGNGLLIDIRDPAKPRRITAVSDPNFAYWHSATFNNDGTKVVFTDEWGGGVLPRCTASDRKEWGANAIFDIVRTRKGLRLRFASYYKLPAPQSAQENCVAHNGSLVPVPGRDILVQAWYQGGTSVMDFTDSKRPKEIAFFDRGPLLTPEGEPSLAGYWSSYWHNGAVHANEIGRGFDTFGLRSSRHLNAVEIAAARQVVRGDENAQAQRRTVWPASFTTVRAWQSSAQRQDVLTARTVRRLTAAVNRAETDVRKGRTAAAAARLLAASTRLGRSPVEQGLRRALVDLSRAVVQGKS